MNPIISIDQIQKSFDGINVVDNLSFDILEGEIFGLLGPNGAGKTTTISMLSGLFPPTQGKILVAGTDICSSPIESKKLIGVVPQEIALYPDMNAIDNLIFWGKMYGLNASKLQEKIDYSLNLADLHSHAKKNVGTYSGGMKRRLNIAVGLLHDPKLLILDEPTVGIDLQSRRHILNTIKTLNSEGLTVLYSTHYLEEAQELSHRIGIIDKGQIVAIGTLKELIELVGSEDSIEFIFNNNASDIEKLKLQLESMNDIINVNFYTDEDSTKALFKVKNNITLLSRLMHYITESGASINSINLIKPNLEKVFLNLTGRALRDSGE